MIKCQCGSFFNLFRIKVEQDFMFLINGLLVMNEMLTNRKYWHFIRSMIFEHMASIYARSPV